MHGLGFRVALLFIFGASYGTALDAIHTHAGTFEYAHVCVFKMAAWTPLVFGCAGVGLGGLYPIAHAVTGRWPSHEVSWGTMSAALVAFIAPYWVTATLTISNVSKLLIVLVCAIAMFGWLARTTASLGLAMLGAIAGPAVEAGLAHAELLVHARPDFVGIPMWLPALYFCGTLTYGALGHKVFGRRHEA